tara:strand:- start:2154 stop:3101 length:948 start_codon:yes stop_codon:yes gene_type:complete
MSYSPIDPQSALHPSMAMSSNIAAMGSNTNEAWRYGWCPQAYSTGFHYQNSSNSIGFVDKAYMRLRGNADKVNLRFRCLAEGDTGAEIRVVSSDGLTLYATITGLTATPTWYTNTTAISSAADPMDMKVQLKAERGVTLCYGFSFSLEPFSDPAAGSHDSGFVKWDSSIDDLNDPISSEMVNRLIQNPYAIAKDRPSTLVSLFNTITDVDNNSVLQGDSDSTTYETYIRGIIPGDGYQRTYRADVHISDPDDVLDSSSVRINIEGQSSLVLTGEGWLTGTFEMSSGITPFTIDMKMNDAGDNLTLDTVLIRRESS